MKLGVSIKIDVTKIDKARIHEGKKGKYIDLTTFIDTDNPGEYGDHGSISHSQTKEEREAKTKLPILGNVKVFWKQESDPNNISDRLSKPAEQPTRQYEPPPEQSEEPIDDIPF